MRTSVESINNSQMFNFTMKNLHLNKQSKNLNGSNFAIDVKKHKSPSNDRVRLSPDIIEPVEEKLELATAKKQTKHGHKFTIDWGQ